METATAKEALQVQNARYEKGRPLLVNLEDGTVAEGISAGRAFQGQVKVQFPNGDTGTYKPSQISLKAAGSPTKLVGQQAPLDILEQNRIFAEQLAQKDADQTLTATAPKNEVIRSRETAEKEIAKLKEQKLRERREKQEKRREQVRAALREGRKVPPASPTAYSTLGDLSVPIDQNGNCVQPDGRYTRLARMTDAFGRPDQTRVGILRAHGFEFVRDEYGQPVTNEGGVFMSASYEDAAEWRAQSEESVSAQTKAKQREFEDTVDAANREIGYELGKVYEAPGGGTRRISGNPVRTVNSPAPTE